MQARLLMSKVTNNNGEPELEYTKTFVVKGIAKTIELTIREGALKQAALAKAISDDLEKAGFAFSDDPSYLSKILNDPDHDLYKYAKVIASIARHQGLSWIAEAFAQISGGEFVPYPEKGDHE